ncbi:MAG: 30S ribosomal protein S15 [Candidatus Pacebacteria bacterium]|nr:30S ribosomal protein S15 [Candidatus Paceibacterota bacterium]
MLTKEKKQKLIKKFGTHENDTGSSQVQIAILTEEIKELTEHLKSHKHDYSSRRGLLKKVGERRKLLKYLQKEDSKAFRNLSEKLNLKIAQKLQAEEEKEMLKEKKLEAIVSTSDDDDEEEPETK